MWQRGQTVVHQEVWDGRLWAARPLTVVEDTTERTLLWIPHGTVRKVPVTPQHRSNPSDVHRRWRPDGSDLGWYVNLQRPMRRNRVGFEAMDLMLDVVAEPDLSWRWKDREEFDEIVERKIFDPELADRVLAEALATIDDIEHRRPPFDGRWHDWRPDPTWVTPVLPDGWHEISWPSGPAEVVSEPPGF